MRGRSSVSASAPTSPRRIRAGNRCRSSEPTEPTPTCHADVVRLCTGGNASPLSMTGPPATALICMSISGMSVSARTGSPPTTSETRIAQLGLPDE